MLAHLVILLQLWSYFITQHEKQGHWGLVLVLLMYKVNVCFEFRLYPQTRRRTSKTVFSQGEQNRQILSYISDSFTSSKNKREAAELETNLDLS